MIQRRLLATLLALVLMVSLSTQAFAATVTVAPEPVHAVVNPLDPATAKPSMTEDAAIKKALVTFEIPGDLGKPSVSLWTDDGKYGQGPTWNLSWEKDPRLGGLRISYNVAINAQSGEIVSYNVYQNDPNGQPPVMKFAREDAQKLADDWYAKLISADKTAKLQPRQDYHGGSDLTYVWTRMQNGILFPDNSISITLNPSDGMLRNFYRNWDENLTFPTADAVISEQSARASYEKSAAPELVYQRFHSPAGRTEVKLVYMSKVQNATIDAHSGQLVDYNGQAWTGDGNPIDLGKLDAALVTLDKAMTREEALNLARQYLGDDAKAEPSHSSYNAPGQPAGKYADEGPRMSTWNFNWNIEGKEANQNRYLSATIDVDRGLLMGMNSYDGYIADEQLRDKTPISEELARTTAVDLLKKVRPDLINHLMITDHSVTEKYPDWPHDRPLPIQREYYFTFQRLVNGIRFANDTVSVTIDRFSGKMRGFYLNWTDPVFPALSEVKLTPSQAMETFHSEAPLQLSYTRTYAPYPEREPQVRLVYRPYNLYNGSFIDPMTGHLLDYSGRDVTELKRGAEDIAEHPSKREIELMINRGVFEVKDGKFGPNMTMTRGDVAKALVAAFNQGYMVQEFTRMATMGKGGGAPAPSYADVNYDNGYFGYVEAAVRAGILVPKMNGELLNPDELVTNEELALLTSRAMGYATVINMKTNISSAYTDSTSIGARYRNSVGLLAGLEILSNEGDFAPQAQVNRSYVAKVLALATQKSQGRYYY